MPHLHVHKSAIILFNFGSLGHSPHAHTGMFPVIGSLHPGIQSTAVHTAILPMEGYHGVLRDFKVNFCWG